MFGIINNKNLSTIEKIKQNGIDKSMEGTVPIYTKAWKQDPDSMQALRVREEIEINRRPYNEQD